MRIFLLLSFVVFFAHTKETTLTYKGTFGVFGTVGKIENRLKRKNARYEIQTTVTLAGMAKMLLAGQKEEYLSRGHIKSGLMVPDYYRISSQKKEKRTLKEYWIDHRKHQVKKRYRRWKHNKLIKDQAHILPFYAKDDLLTLYFNMDTHIKKHRGLHSFKLKAVGLEKQKGVVKITVASPKEVLIYRKDIDKSADWYAKALIVQKNFRRKKGNILLSVGEDGFIQKAVIKDILFYGDAQLERIK
jgi:sRNA-binding carbon storage regulator CsrA